ncbi:hypothetical protein B0H17DRAFT_208744 [Mycena rosella]|uniref:Uncharacterized protein n=1 Tax=Mycena rosella TaxID=1033263 RepID=A0AAD7CZ16_MYCRO|nr:hypothetical protein B0H17DRAFT_208744 [Mycena rosella]
MIGVIVFRNRVLLLTFDEISAFTPLPRPTSFRFPSALSSPVKMPSLSSALSLYSIPAVWATAFVPVMLKSITIARTKGFDNVRPRGNTSRVAADKAVPAAISARIERMEGAHMNGNENFPIWVAAVLAGNFAGLDNYTLNVISISYFCGRVLYDYIYINQATRMQSALRSLVFFSSLSLPMYLLFASAAKVANQ